MRREMHEDEWGRPMNPGDILEMIVRSQEADPEMGQPPSGVEHQRSEAAEETRRKPIISIH